MPLPLSVNLVLVPVKTRTPKFEQDGATGYINLCAVDQITPHQTETGTSLHSCLVKLKGGRHLPVLYSTQTTKKRLEKGEQALTSYKAIRGYPNPAAAALIMESSPNGTLEASSTGGRFKCELLIDYQPDLYSKKVGH